MLHVTSAVLAHPPYSTSMSCPMIVSSPSSATLAQCSNSSPNIGALLAALVEPHELDELNGSNCPRPPSSFRIDDLSDDRLEPILGHIGPINQLLSKYRGVCSRWRNLIEDMC